MKKGGSLGFPPSLSFKPLAGKPVLAVLDAVQSALKKPHRRLIA